MAKKRNSTSFSARSRNGNYNKRKKSNKSVYIAVGFGVLAIIGAILWMLNRKTGYQFQRAHLDKYIELARGGNLLNNSASVYLDMSDGMIHAYATKENREMLQTVIDKLAATAGISFFELSKEDISQLDMTHTELYNYMLNPSSYAKKQMAPLEKSLSQIVEKEQPSVLISDFEEYSNGVIQKAAYAKKYFIDWLAKGYNITFYKWAFNENGQDKYLFLAVFDDNAQRLNSMVGNAVERINPDINKYVLGSKYFAYPTAVQYISFNKGGNYHSHEGKDNVTNVMENGGSEDYISYAKPYATASGTTGTYSPLDISLGTFAEYYPLGVNWKGAIENSAAFKEIQDTKDKFIHLLSGLSIDFGAQNGYSIDGIEARVFDMQATMEAIGNMLANGEKVDMEKINAIENPEINTVMTAGMQPSASGWANIYVDFDKQFDGTFPGGIPTTDLIRINIVISKAYPEIDEARQFFKWEGNESLSNSVIEALTAASSNPEGRILFTYYMKTLSE